MNEKIKLHNLTACDSFQYVRLLIKEREKGKCNWGYNSSISQYINI